MTQQEARQLLRDQVVRELAQGMRQDVREARSALARLSPAKRSGVKALETQQLLQATEAFIEYLEAWK